MRLSRLLRWLLQRNKPAQQWSVTEEAIQARWPHSMRGVKAVWTPKGYVLHRMKPDGTSEVVSNNQDLQAELGMPGYGGTPPGVGYG